MAKQFKPRDRLVAAFLLAMAIANGIEFWQQRARIKSGYGDFSALYTSGLLVRRGEGTSLYERHEQWRVQQQFAANVDIRKGPMPFIRPPFEALVFLPLTYFSYPLAFGIWSAIKVLLLWLSIRILPRASPFSRNYPSWLEVVLGLGYLPVFLDLLQAQDAILLLLIVAATLNRLQSNKDVAAGALLSLGLFRFHLLVPIAIILWLAGRARVFAGFVPGSVALAALSCAVSGPRVLFIYPKYLIDLNRAAGVGVVTAQSMPNLRGFLTAFLEGRPFPGPPTGLFLPFAFAPFVVTPRLGRPTINRNYPVLHLGVAMTF